MKSVYYYKLLCQNKRVSLEIWLKTGRNKPCILRTLGSAEQVYLMMKEYELAKTIAIDLEERVIKVIRKEGVRK